MPIEKQVEKSHSEFQRYVGRQRWISMWHQLDELMHLRPERVLEIGPGSGLLKVVAGQSAVRVDTLDLIADLNPDHVD